MSRAVAEKRMLATRTFRLNGDIGYVLQTEAERQFLSSWRTWSFAPSGSDFGELMI